MRSAERDLFPQEDDLAMIFELERKRRIDAVPIFGEDPDRFPQCRLVDDQEADHPDVGKLALLGHPEAERLASG